MAATTATAVVSQLLARARQRLGPVQSASVPQQLWEQMLEEVAAAGGDVGFDHCVVDGVTVRSLPAGDDSAATFQVTGANVPQRLPPT